MKKTLIWLGSGVYTDGLQKQCLKQAVQIWSQFTVYLSVVTVYLTYMNSAGFLNGFSEPE
jgi:hypothetical protein